MAEDVPAARSDLQELRDAWMNEKAAPEILQFKSELVSRLLELTSVQERSLVDSRDSHDLTTANLYWMDLNRANFLLRAYLRTRLVKIEEHVFHIMGGDNSLLMRLSPQELTYTDAVDTHFNASVLHALPKQYESILKQIDDGDDDNRSFDMIPEPNLNSHVILRVKESRKNVALGDDSRDLDAGELLIMSYRSAAPYLEDGSMQLL